MIPQLESVFEDAEKEIALLGETLSEADESGKVYVQWEE